MGDTVKDQSATSHVEARLRAELARSDRALGGVTPILSHLLASPGYSLVNEDIVARVRGMLSDLARQLFVCAWGKGAESSPSGHSIDALEEELLSNGPVLSHLYSLAMEGHLTQRLAQRSSLDPSLSPLLQELIASDDDEIADMSMRTLAAQSRFIQAQRRMSLPLLELPALILTSVTQLAETHIQPVRRAKSGDQSPVSFGHLRENYDEASTRLGLMTRLAAAMRKGVVAALELDHAGLALFTTALATLTRQPRDISVLACHERQAARLALALRAAGLDEIAIERQFLLLEPAERLPRNIADIAPQKAVSLLSGSRLWQKS